MITVYSNREWVRECGGWGVRALPKLNLRGRSVSQTTMDAVRLKIVDAL